MFWWRTLCRDSDPKYLVRGTEIDCTFYGPMHRFMIYSVRALVPAPEWSDNRFELDFEYHVRDAESISDAQVKAGERPKVVARFKTLEEATRYCDKENECYGPPGATT